MSAAMAVLLKAFLKALYRTRIAESKSVATAVLSCCLFLAACAGGPLPIGAMSGKPDKADDSMPAYSISQNTGNDAFFQAELKQELLQSYGPIQNATLTDYLNGLEQRILKQAGAPSNCCRVVLLSDMSLNAHATESGAIYVTMGWVLQADDEAELVGLLSHETGHILYGDHSAQHLSDIATIAPQLLALGEVGKAIGSKTSTTLLATRRLLYGAAFVQQLVQPTWTRAQERRADRLSVVLTYELGYSVARGTKAMLERIASTGKVEEKTAKQATKVVQKQEQRLDLQVQQYLNEQVANLEGQLNAQIARLSQDHDAAQERIDDAVAWYRVVRQDPQFVAGPPQDNGLDALRSRPDVAALIGRYRDLEAARQAEARGDLNGALRAAQQATLPPLANAPVALSEQCMVLALGRVPMARQCAAASLEHAGGSWLPYMDAAHIYRDQNDPRDGLKILELGFARLGQPDLLYPDIIDYAKEIDPGTRNRYFEMCTSWRHVADIRLRDACGHARPTKAEQEAASKKAADQIMSSFKRKK